MTRATLLAVKFGLKWAHPRIGNRWTLACLVVVLRLIHFASVVAPLQFFFSFFFLLLSIYGNERKSNIVGRREEKGLPAFRCQWVEDYPFCVRVSVSIFVFSFPILFIFFWWGFRLWSNDKKNFSYQPSWRNETERYSKVDTAKRIPRDDHFFFLFSIWTENRKNWTKKKKLFLHRLLNLGKRRKWYITFEKKKKKRFSPENCNEEKSWEKKFFYF